MLSDVSKQCSHLNIKSKSYATKPTLQILTLLYSGCYVKGEKIEKKICKYRAFHNVLRDYKNLL